MQLPEVKALIRVTTASNVQCRHCYVRSGVQSKDEIGQPELEKIVEELEDYQKILQQYFRLVESHVLPVKDYEFHWFIVEKP